MKWPRMVFGVIVIGLSFLGVTDKKKAHVPNDINFKICLFFYLQVNFNVFPLQTKVNHFPSDQLLVESI